MVNEGIGWALRPNATGKARATLGFALLYSGGRGGGEIIVLLGFDP